MRHAFTSLVCASLLLTGAGLRPAQAQSPDAEIQVQMSEARRHFDALEYEQAVPSLDRAMASLQGLRTSKVMDEKKVQQSTVSCAQLQFTAALAEAVSFETIRQSVSKQQLEYLTGSDQQ